jgi:hypothetical protein
LEREVSSTVSLGGSLVALAALLGLVFFMVFMGNGVREDAGQALSGIRDQATVNYIRDIASGATDNEMPAATAYNILKTYSDVIEEAACGYDGTVSNLMTEDPCIGNNLTGRVQLELQPINGGSTYVAFIHGVDCNWREGVCSDPNRSGFEKLKQKYNITTKW